MRAWVWRCPARRLPVGVCGGVQRLVVREASSARVLACCSVAVPVGPVRSEWVTAGGHAGRGGQAGFGIGRLRRQIGALLMAPRVPTLRSGLVGAVARGALWPAGRIGSPPGI